MRKPCTPLSPGSCHHYNIFTGLLMSLLWSYWNLMVHRGSLLLFLVPAWHHGESAILSKVESASHRNYAVILDLPSPSSKSLEATCGGLKGAFFLFISVHFSKTGLCSQDWSSESKTKAGVMDGVSPKRWGDLCCPCMNCSHPAYASLKSIFRRDFHPGQSKWGFFICKTGLNC